MPDRSLIDAVAAAELAAHALMLEGEALTPDERAAWLARASTHLVTWDALVGEAIDALRVLPGKDAELESRTVALDEAVADLAQLTGAVRLAAGEPERFAGYGALGQALELLRREAGMSQQQLANELNMSASMVSHVEGHRRDRRAPLETVAAWARACDRELLLVFARRGAPEAIERITTLLSRVSPEDLDIVERLILGLIATSERSTEV